MRKDLETIQSWIRPRSRILDLGCGKGTLLAHLMGQKHVTGYGLEIDDDNIEACIKAGVNVIRQNLDCGLANFSDKSFDTVIMTQALQAVRFPDKVLDEMLRVGQECIVTFPNFGHWRCRYYLSAKGQMPISRQLPHTWYNTPNIHLCTFKDFEALCKEKSIRIANRAMVNQNHEQSWIANLWPNLFSEIAIYRISND